MNPVQFILILLVRVYRLTLSPAKIFILGPSARCRFTPSCSQYAVDALKTHGALRGGWLATRRLCRCHPWGDFGDDPVPPKEVRRQKADGRSEELAGTAVEIAPGHSR